MLPLDILVKNMSVRRVIIIFFFIFIVILFLSYPESIIISTEEEEYAYIYDFYVSNTTIPVGATLNISMEYFLNYNPETSDGFASIIITKNGYTLMERYNYEMGHVLWTEKYIIDPTTFSPGSNGTTITVSGFVTIIGSSYYQESREIDVLIKRAEPMLIEMNYSNTILYNQSFWISAIVVNSYNTSYTLSNVQLRLIIKNTTNDVYNSTAVTDEQGFFYFSDTSSNLIVGNYTLEIIFEGNEDYLPFNISLPLVVCNRTSDLNVYLTNETVYASNMEYGFLSEINITVSYIDVESNLPLKNYAIECYLNGTLVYCKSSIVSENYSFIIIAPETPGKYILEICATKQNYIYSRKKIAILVLPRELLILNMSINKVYFRGENTSYPIYIGIENKLKFTIMDKLSLCPIVNTSKLSFELSILNSNSNTCVIHAKIISSGFLADNTTYLMFLLPINIIAMNNVSLLLTVRVNSLSYKELQTLFKNLNLTIFQEALYELSISSLDVISGDFFNASLSLNIFGETLNDTLSLDIYIDNIRYLSEEFKIPLNLTIPININTEGLTRGEHTLGISLYYMSENINKLLADILVHFYVWDCTKTNLMIIILD